MENGGESSNNKSHTSKYVWTSACLAFERREGKQGIKHVENFNNVVETPAPPNTTTEAGPGM